MFCYVIERTVWTRVLWIVAGLGLVWGAYVLAVQPGKGRPAESPVVAERPRDNGEAAPAMVAPPPSVSIDLDDPRSWPAAATSGREAPGTDADDLLSLFDDYRLERERLRARRLEAIQRVIDDPHASEARRWESHGMLLSALADQAREVELEYLLRARGYADAIVTIQEDYANVAVPLVLNETDAARIGELVSRIAGVPLERIAIIDSYTRSLAHP